MSEDKKETVDDLPCDNDSGIYADTNEPANIKPVEKPDGGEQMKVPINSSVMDWRSMTVAAVILFLVAVQFSIYFASLWPYLSQITCGEATETFYGFVIASFSFGQMISSPVYGFVSNKMKRSRPPIAVGVVISVMANIVYVCVESFPQTSQKFVVLGCRFVCGLGAGLAGVIRAYVATTSTAEHRTRAIGIATASLALGVTAGPAIQVLFTPLGYPGIRLGPFHINEYTAPACVSVISCAILLLLLFTIFRDSRQAYKGLEARRDENPYKVLPKFDKPAALLCIWCYFTMYFCITNQETVESPYTMTIFNWSSSDAVLYNSIIFSVSAFIQAVSYVGLAAIGKRINERLSIVAGLCLLGGFYVVTYTWPFFTGTLTFVNGTSTSAYSANTTAPSQCDTGRSAAESLTGCRTEFEWCHFTPRLPLPVYLAAYPLMSLGMPATNVALSTLFSKILGPRRQALMQSFMIMSGSGARLLGPFLISYLYSSYGPRVAWLFTTIAVSSSITLVMIYWHRLVPLDPKPNLKSGDRMKYTGGTLYRF